MQIFISYSSKSRPAVEVLAADLESSGHTVWFDQNVLTGGHKWWGEILDRIRRCDVLLLALTPDALDSEPCRLEYGYAYALGKNILPVTLAKVEITALPSMLGELQIVDYQEQNKKQALDLNRALNKLPPVKPLPDPLPAEPPTPLPPLVRIRDRIEAKSLSFTQQINLVTELKVFLEDEKTAPNARALLENLRKRDDLLAKADKEIATMLGIETPPARQIEPRTFVGHRQAVTSASFSPDGLHILTGSYDNTARLWNLETGVTVHQLRGHNHIVYSAVFSRDGKLILTGSRDKTARLWNAETGLSLRQITGHDRSITAVAFSPDGQTFLTSSWDNTARLWDAVTAAERRQFIGHTDIVWNAAFSPDGQTILTSSADYTARLWDTQTGQECCRLDHTHIVYGAAFSPDGRYVLTGSRDKIARLWDAKTGKVIRHFPGHADSVLSVAFSPDGQHILTGSGDKTAWVWELETGKIVQELIGHTDSVLSVAFSPDGQYALTGSADATVRLWELV